MKQSFWVNSKLEKEVKSLVREYPSLRHISEPFPAFGKVQFFLSGDVEEFNSFDLRLEEMERKLESENLTPYKPTGMLKWLSYIFRR